MTAQRAERAIHILSIVGIWIAVLMAWGFRSRQVDAWASRGGDLPAPTLLWLEFADSWLAFALPAMFTILVIWLVRSRSPHANWVAGSLLLLGLVYGAFAQAAAILPTFSMCTSV